MLAQVPSRIEFTITPGPTTTVIAVTPVIDGVLLTDRVRAYQRECGWDDRGDYLGIVPAYFKHGDAHAYWLDAEAAQPGGFFEDAGKIPVLDCTCGQWGCSPFIARVSATEGMVTWSDFANYSISRCESDRHYSKLGPFVFGRDDYEAAVDAIADAWSRGSYPVPV
jgi:hypothetical protein